MILDRDPYCNGVLLWGLDAAADDLAGRIRVAASNPVCKGFTMDSRSFGDVAHGWFAGEVNDGEATECIARTFERTIAVWQEAARDSPGESLRSIIG